MARTYDSTPAAPHVLRGLLAGAAGGLAGAFLMNQVHSAWSAVARELEAAERAEDDDGEDTDDGEPEETSASDEPATAKAAEAISEGVFDHRLTREEKASAEPAVHYAFGAIMGGVYGALVEWQRGAAALGGVPFGTALWLVADEIGVPAAGLSASSLDAPLPTHARSLLAHVVYGLTTEGVRRAICAVA